jgi:hypothetical protein
MATQDLRDALAGIRKAPERLGLTEEELELGVVITAVSVSAYVATAVAAELAQKRLPLRIKALCLLCPAVDLLEGIDVFRRRNGIEMFTTRVFLNQPKYRLSVLQENWMEFLGTKTGTPYFLLDVCLRGPGACKRDYFTKNLMILKGKGIPVFVGHSPRDQMTRFADVQAAVKGAGLERVHEFPWWHDLDAQQFVFSPYLEYGNKCPALAEFVAFLRKNR